MLTKTVENKIFCTISGPLRFQMFWSFEPDNTFYGASTTIVI